MEITDSPLYVVDANVWNVAQIQDGVDEECHLEALRFIHHLDSQRKRIAVDGNHLIFKEYFGQLSEQQAPYGILTRLITQGRVVHRAIAVDEGIARIPDDLERIVHDRKDRKFVAVSLSFSRPPPVVNATDRDWVDWVDALEEHDIEVIQLCPEVVHAPRSPAERRA